MNFLKNLFKKQPIVQETLNLGKITSTVYFNNGNSRDWLFVGEYSGSWEFMAESWVDDHITAEEEFQAWLKKISKRKFVKIDGNTFIPLSDIAKITTKKEDNFVETKRGE